MFSRKTQTPDSAQDSADGPRAAGRSATSAGKGRATPSRKEAEAAARARAKVPRTRKEMAAANRLARSGGRVSAVDLKTGMRTSDESRWPARDRGPVRHFVRDMVDARLGFLQLAFPLMLLSLVLNAVAGSASGNSGNIGSDLELVVIALIVLDTVWVRFRLGREVGRRFPGTSLKGLAWYSFSRSIYPKFLRRPPTMIPPGVRIGESLPDTYR